MEIYTVGGAVRDELLGLAVKDRDYVVVGATAEDMVRLGYVPVGKDFPVFLHPRTHEEYALARTERKSARGYRGFTVYSAPDVTLEQDLARRDLTINAIARGADGSLIDPYGGERDLRAGILRHVSAAFVEDPVRVLRVARFAARFAQVDFIVAPETHDLMCRMVADGEIDHLVPERVWQELAKGLLEVDAARMFLILRDVGALARVLPEFEDLFTADSQHAYGMLGSHALTALQRAAQLGETLEVRFAAMLARVPAERLPAMCERVRAPTACRDLALMTARHREAIEHAQSSDAQTLLTLFERTDALRRPERFDALLRACGSDRAAWPEHANQALHPSAQRLTIALAAAAATDAGAAARAAASPAEIPRRVREARIEAVHAALAAQRPA